MSSQLFACGFGAMFCAMLPPAVGFGCSISFCVLWYLLDDMKLLDVDASSEALLGTVTLLNIVVNCATSVQWRTEVNLKSAFFLFLFQAPGAFLGTILVKHYGEALWFQRMAGLIFFLCIAYIYWKYKTHAPETKFDFNDIWNTRKTTIAVSVASVISGVFSGVGGIGGAPFILLALMFNFSREQFIGTYMTSCLMVSFMVFGILLFKDNAYEEDLIISAVGSMIGGGIGVMLGKELSRKVKHRNFVRSLRAILLASSLFVIFEESGVKEYIVLITIASLISIEIALRQFYKFSTMEHEVLRENSTLQTSGGTFKHASTSTSVKSPGDGTGSTTDFDVNWGAESESNV